MLAGATVAKAGPMPKTHSMRCCSPEAAILPVTSATRAKSSSTVSPMGRIPRVGVEGINPDFVTLAKACHCHSTAPRDETEFQAAFRNALAAARPPVIVVREGEGLLQ